MGALGAWNGGMQTEDRTQGPGVREGPAGEGGARGWGFPHNLAPASSVTLWEQDCPWSFSPGYQNL